MKYLNCITCGCEKKTYGAKLSANCFDCSNRTRKRICRSKQKFPGHAKWAKLIKERDGACIDCGSIERLEAHHLILRSKFPEVAYELWNGITLCRKCHHKEHKIIGRI